MFFKSKRQKEAEARIKKREQEILGYLPGERIMAGIKLIQFRQEFERDVGGIDGFMDKSSEERREYVSRYYPVVRKAEADGEKEVVSSALLFIDFLLSVAYFDSKTATKAIQAMQKVQDSIDG